MYADIAKGNIVNISRDPAKPSVSPRGKWVPVVEEGANFDPIVEQRIGPEVVIEIDKVRLVYTVQAHPDAAVRFTKSLYARLDDKFTEAVGTVKAEYPEDEIKTWDKQESEAVAYTADSTNAVTPLIDAMVAKTGEDKATLVVKILEKAQIFAKITGNILGRKRAITEMIILAGDDLAELCRIESDELQVGWE